MSWQDFYEKKIPLIEARIRSAGVDLYNDGQLRNAITYSLEAGGKRIRPFLAILTAHLLGRDDEYIFPYAIALEFIHTYSLIHDDLPAMDDDDLRRGKPSCHRAFGEDTAILAGDALLTDSFRLLFNQGKGNVVAAGRYLSNAAGGIGMVEGQMLDCTIPEEERDIATLDRINLLKTGRMLQASLAGAAAWCDAPATTIDALDGYGRNIGLAFQIADDILDIVADEKELGKPVGSDEKLNKKTYPALLGIDRAREEGMRYVERAKACLEAVPRNEFRDMLSEFSVYIMERSM